MEELRAPRVEASDFLHGADVADPYRWLEDAHDPRTLAWEAAQSESLSRERVRWKYLESWRELLATAFHVDLVSTPRQRGGKIFVTRLRVGQDHPVLTVSENGVERPLVDPLAVNPDGDTVLEGWEPSLDGTLVAYQLSAGGDEDCVLWVIDVTSGEHRDGPIDRLRRSSIAWLPDGSGFYYVRRLPPDENPGEELYHRRVFLHILGRDPVEDVLIFGDGRDKTDFYIVSLTADGRWLAISVTRGTAPSNELWIGDLTVGSPTRPRLVPVDVEAPSRNDIRIIPGTGPDDPVWLRTDLHAPRGRVVAASMGSLEAASWRTVVPERPDAVLEDVVPLIEGPLERPVALVSWSRQALFELTVHDLTDGFELAKVALPGAGRVAAVTAAPEYRCDAWFHYTDYTTPPHVYRFDARTTDISPWRPASATGLGRPATTRQVAYTSGDGTTVRMFVVSPFGVPQSPRPTILTGYGGFGQSMFPNYMPHATAWVAAGGVFAVACLRGGAEEGREWHRAAMGVNKIRAVEDMNAAADALIEQGWCAPGQLGLFGQSNGGLVASSAAVQRPARYAAVACLAPLTDMIRYERSGMGPSWRAEYGTVEDPDEFRALLSYSPYHLVRNETAYPPFLLGTFDADSRVDPAHARKLTAALQHASIGPGPVVYRLERDTGHGARATSRMIDVVADVMAFFGHHLNLAPVDRA